MVDSGFCVVDRFADSVASTLDGLLNQCQDSCYLRAFGPGSSVSRSQLVPVSDGVFDVYRLSYLINPQVSYESLTLSVSRSASLVTGQEPADRECLLFREQALRAKEGAVNTRQVALIDAILQVSIVETDITGKPYLSRQSYPDFGFSINIEPDGRLHACHVDNSENERVFIYLRPEIKICRSVTGNPGAYRPVCPSDIQPFCELFPVVSCWAERALRVGSIE